MSAAAQLHRNATSPQRIAWLREHIRLYARDLAAWTVAGDGKPHEHECENLLAAFDTAKSHGIPRDEALIAARAEWDAGTKRAQEFMNALRKKIRSLAFERAPAADLHAAADDLNNRFDFVLPTYLLDAAVRRIVQGTLRRG